MGMNPGRGKGGSGEGGSGTKRGSGGIRLSEIGINFKKLRIDKLHPYDFCNAWSLFGFCTVR